jgi:hypothetical protein
MLFQSAVQDAECHEMSLPSVPASNGDAIRHPGLLDICLHEYQLLKGNENSRMFSLSLDEFCNVFGS